MHPVYIGTFERSFDPPRIMWEGDAYLEREFVFNCSKDLGRSIDYLETRSDMDVSKLAYFGLSWGAQMGGINISVEKRFKTGILYVGGIWVHDPPKFPEIDLLNFAPRVKIPILMLNGRYDHWFPYETSQIPLYNMLGTSEQHKDHYIYDSWHFVPQEELAKETLNWLDKYLGPVE